ncbi:MAG: restriction endonuclease [Candidatus Aminicenantes bacterium]|nr:restriction endonuclease [Candidatus Aminicenantes bacterium]
MTRSRIVIYSPRGEVYEKKLFKWISRIGTEILRDTTIDEVLSPKNTEALVLFGGNKKIGDLELLSDRFRNLVQGKFVYHIGCQSQKIASEILDFGAIGFIGFKNRFFFDLRSRKTGGDLAVKATLSGIKALQKKKKAIDIFNILRENYIKTYKKSIELYKKKKCSYLTVLGLKNNANSIFFMGDPNWIISSDPVTVVVTTKIGHKIEKRVNIIDITPEIIEWLREDPKRISKLKPDQFENLIANRLELIRFNVKKIGNTYSQDGGIDLIAWPKSTHLPFLIAIQAKHKQTGSPIGPSVVREFKGAIESHPIDIGLLVTNTRFTPSARWFRDKHAHIIRLRDFDDLRNWINSEFDKKDVLGEIPDYLELAPGLIINIPKILYVK